MFFAPTDIQPGDLTLELKQRLEASRHLIVICSPRSARSEWVGREIAYFHSLGREANIHFFIVDGTPNSADPATECFNPIVRELGMPELLAANIHEKVFRWPWLNRERAYAQLISKLLGVEFDAIWKRQRRRLIARSATVAVLSIAVASTIFGVWKVNQPIDINVNIAEDEDGNPALPRPTQSVMQLNVGNEIKRDTLAGGFGKALFRNIPASFIGKEVTIKWTCENYLPVDTSLILNEDVTLRAYRDPSVFGTVRFRIWDMSREEYLRDGAGIELNGQTVLPDSAGVYALDIPLQEQAPFYVVNAPVRLADDTLHMPCGDNAVLFAE